MVNFGPLAVQIVSLVWGTHANFNGFRVLAALLHSTLVVGVSQTLWRWTEGATYIRQGSHRVGYWLTFLVAIYFHYTYWLTQVGFVLCLLTLYFCPVSFFFFFSLAWSQWSQTGWLPYFHSWCGLSANLECRSEMYCTRLAQNTGCKKRPKKSPSWHHHTTLLSCIFATEACIDNQQYLLHMS